MTADLLEKTITITSRMLADAEQRFPGVRGQISELLLVGGSSWMPAVAERLRKEFPLGAEDRRPGPRGRQGRGPVRGGPDGQAGRGGACRGGSARPARSIRQRSRAARCRPGRRARRPSRPSPSRPAGRRAGRRTSRARRSSTCCPRRWASSCSTRQARAGTSCPTTEPFYIEHLVHAQTQLPFDADEVHRRAPPVANQESIEIEIWEQAGAVPDQALVGQPPGRRRGPHRGPRVVPAARRVADRHHLRGRRRGHRQPARGRADQRQGAHMSVKIAIMSDEKVGRSTRPSSPRCARSGRRSACHGFRREGVREVPHQYSRRTDRSPMTCLSGTRSPFRPRDDEIARAAQGGPGVLEQEDGGADRPRQDGQVVQDGRRRARREAPGPRDRRLVAGRAAAARPGGAGSGSRTWPRLLKQDHGTLGVVTAAALEKAAGSTGLTAAQAEQAAGLAKLAVIPAKRDPARAPPIPQVVFSQLGRELADCGARSVPDLIHPGSGHVPHRRAVRVRRRPGHAA